MNLHRIRIKMCGMTRREDIDHALHLGIDAIGLIFYPKSSRYVSIHQAKALLTELPPLMTAVAVLVNPSKDEVLAILDELPIQLLQFHGDETPEFCQQFNHPYIKAFHPKHSEQIQQVTDVFKQAKAVLLDTPSENSRGGTGQIFDWQLIPKDLAKPYFLAGGLNELNVVDAVTTCSPYAVDVCSGIEAMPGVKDHNKMSRFVKALWDRKL